MELQRWKVFKNIDCHFVADVKRAYLVGITTSIDTIWHEGRYEVLPWSGGVMVMKNNDVYFTTLTTNVDREFTIKKGDNYVPYVPVKIDALCGQEIRDVQSGIGHVVVLTTDGRVFWWGDLCSEEERQVGVCELCFLSGNDNEKERIIQIACGENHALALTAKGQVYSWGSNDDGQLGIEHDAHVTGPTKVSGLNGFHSEISQIACGDVTSFALDIEGNVWAWGDLSNEIRGHSANGHQFLPYKITVLWNINMISAGSRHVLALSNEKKLYFWGQHSSERRTLTPIRMASKVASIGTTRGCSVSAFQTTEGKVYYWGFALGQQTSHPVATKYRTVMELFALRR